MEALQGMEGRAPHGARELKSVHRGRFSRALCRAPHGARELKSYPNDGVTLNVSRAPHGARELKFVECSTTLPRWGSCPAWGT